MSIQVDNRAGSVDLIPILRRLGCEIESTRLDYGDVAWMGYGENGMPVNVGVEVKTLSDVLACITSGRFAGHQLPGLVACYNHIWLLVQGEWRARPRDGVLEQAMQGRGGGVYWTPAGGGQRTWLWRDLEAWFTSMSVLGGLRVQRVQTWDDGALWLKTVYNWFQKDDHKSHLVLYSGKELYSDQALLVKPSLARRVAKELPGVGLVRSEAVAHRFRSVADMVHADIKDWMSIDGIGKGIAEKIYRAVHGTDGDRN